MDHTDWGVEDEMIYLVRIAAELGWGAPTGMGVSPLPFAEIAAYSVATGINLEPWETMAIRSISEGYASGAQDERKDVDPAWWTELDGLLIPLVPLVGMEVIEEDGMWKEVPAND